MTQSGLVATIEKIQKREEGFELNILGDHTNHPGEFQAHLHVHHTPTETYTSHTHIHHSHHTHSPISITILPTHCSPCDTHFLSLTQPITDRLQDHHHMHQLILLSSPTLYSNHSTLTLLIILLHTTSPDHCGLACVSFLNPLHPSPPHTHTPSTPRHTPLWRYYTHHSPHTTTPLTHPHTTATDSHTSTCFQ